jgi:putative sigma-54 modulation protein
MKVQTEAIHFSADAKLLASIEKKIQRLTHFFEHINDARVILKLENSGQVRDKIAEIKLMIPNGVIFIKETSKTFEAAIDAAVLSLKRQLVKQKEKKSQKAVKKIDFLDSEE